MSPDEYKNFKRISIENLTVLPTIFILIFLIIKLYLLCHIQEEKEYSIDFYGQIGILNSFTTILILLLTVTIVDSINKRYLIFVLYLILIINSLSFYLLPKVYGYYLTDRGDSLSSLGYLRTILETGYTDKLDPYPLPFIELSVIHLITGIDFSNLPWIYVSVVNLLIIIGIYIFTRIFYPKTPQSFIMLFSVAPWVVFYHTSTVAQIYGFSYIFLLIYLILRNNEKFKILLIISAIFIALSHPFNAIFTFNLLFILLMYNKLINKESPYLKNVFLVFVSALITWTTHNYLMAKSLKNFRDTFLQAVFERSYIAQQFEYVAGYLSILEVIYYYFIKFLPINFISLCIILKILKFNRKLLSDFLKDISFILSIAGILMLSILIFIKHGFDRILGLNYLLFALISVFLFLYSEIIKNFSNNFQKIIKIAIFLVISFSVYSIYPSPVNGSVFNGITQEELFGATFALSKVGDEKIIDTLAESKRWSLWYYGPSQTFTVAKVLYLYKLPDHFGYDAVESLSQNKYIIKVEHNIFGEYIIESYDYSKLLICIPKAHIKIYEESEIYKRVSRFNFVDLLKLNSDDSVNKVYMNNEFFIYKL